MVNHHFSAIYHDDYFFWYTTQLGYPLLESIILLLLGGSVYSLQLVNCLLIEWTIIAIYIIGKNNGNVMAGRLAALFYASYIGLFSFSAVLSNQHASACFIFSGLALLSVRKNEFSLVKLFFAGLLIGIGNVMYPIGILFLLVLLFYVVIFMRQRLTLLVKRIVVLIGGYVTPIVLVSSIIIVTGMSVYGITHYDNQWKFVIGLNEKTNGQYSLADFNDLKKSYIDRDEAKHQASEQKMIAKRLASNHLYSLFYKKSLNMWAYPDDSYRYTQLYPYGEKFQKAVRVFYVEMAVSQYFAFYLLAFLSLLVSILRKTKKKDSYILYLLLIGGFLIYLVTEQQIRYRYFFTPMIILIAVQQITDWKPIVERMKGIRFSFRKKAR